MGGEHLVLFLQKVNYLLVKFFVISAVLIKLGQKEVKDFLRVVELVDF